MARRLANETGYGSPLKHEPITEACGCRPSGCGSALLKSGSLKSDSRPLTLGGDVVVLQRRRRSVRCHRVLFPKTDNLWSLFCCSRVTQLATCCTYSILSIYDNEREKD